MRKISVFIIQIFIFCSIPVINFAQDRRSVETHVADILAKMPVNDLNYQNRLMEEIISMGDEGIGKIVAQLKAPGEGDDVAVRFALNSLSVYANRFGTEKNRSLVEKNLINALSTISNKDIKAFILSLLKFTGGDNTVDAVSVYLTDETLCEFATQTLLCIKTEKSKKSLLNALQTATGKKQITIIKALGEKHAVEANSSILKLLQTTDANLKKVVLASLAAIGSPESYNQLLDAAKSKGFGYDPTNASASFEIYIDRLGETGNYKICKKACNEIIKNCKPDNLLHISAYALSLLDKYFGYEAIPELLKAFDNNNKAYRKAILAIAEKNKDVAVTRVWIEKAEKSADEPKAEIISMLGKKGDLTAVTYVESNLESTSDMVSIAAISVLAELSGTGSIPALINYLKTGKDVKQVCNTLSSLIDEKHLDLIVDNLELMPSASKAGAFGIISAKLGKRFFDVVYKFTSSDDTILKNASISALPNLSSEEKIQPLVDLLIKVSQSGHIALVQQSLVNASMEIPYGKHRSEPYLKILNDQKIKILPILSQLGGKDALNTLIEMFNKSQENDQQMVFDAITKWSDYSASAFLYNQSKIPGNKYHQGAFAGFVKQISSSQLPADQKLLQLRKIMDYAINNEEKSLILKELSNVKTFLSLLFASKYLDDKNLQNDASLACIRIAMPETGEKTGLYGKLVSDILQKVMANLTIPEADYYKESIRKYLTDMPKDEGYVSLFNGKDLQGWQGLAGDPIKRSKMSKDELNKKQIEANKKMQNNWKVKDGCIVFNGEGDNLCSVKSYGDFEMFVDWLISKNGDSGIYLRGSPQVQIWDTSRVDVGAQVGSGGLYNNQKNKSIPLVVADNPIGEWNTFYIKMIGEKVTVYLNGILVVDNVILENFWDRNQPIFPTGAIELQAHGTDLAFRNIYVREIKSEEYNLTDDEKAEGFISLFNGKNLDGWVGDTIAYVVEDNQITTRPKEGSIGNLYTEKEYSDFMVRFEFQLTPAANNGLGIRAPLEGDAAYVGMELQILDDDASVYVNLQPYQYHGSVYGVIPAKRGFQKPVGQWNYEEVIAAGTRVKVILNGTVIVDGDIKEASEKGTMDHRDHPGLKRTTGHIGFLGHGDVVKFRNIRVKSLK